MLFNTAFQSALSIDIMAEHPELWSEVQFRITADLICWELKFNLNSNRYILDMLWPGEFSFLQDISGAIFQQDTARQYVA